MLKRGPALLARGKRKVILGSRWCGLFFLRRAARWSCEIRGFRQDAGAMGELSA